MRCRRSIKGVEDYFEENVDRYFEERNEEFIKLITSMAEDYLSNVEGDRIPSVVDFSSEMDEEFDFPLEYDWLDREYEGFIDECADQRYEEDKDRRMGL